MRGVAQQAGAHAAEFENAQLFCYYSACAFHSLCGFSVTIPQCYFASVLLCFSITFIRWADAPELPHPAHPVVKSSLLFLFVVVVSTSTVSVRLAVSRSRRLAGSSLECGAT